MSLEDYTVKVTDQRNVTNGAKLTVALIEDETGEVVSEERKGVSTRQLNDGKFDERLRQWGEHLAKDYEEDKEDVTEQEYSLGE